MRTTLNIPDELLSTLKKVTGEKTKTKAICIAIDDYIRKKKIEKLISLSGKIKIDYDWKNMEELEIKEIKEDAKKWRRR